jgi:AmmeMemoRadiSam system protein B
MATEVKHSTLAGTWYPADPRELRQEVERALGDERHPDAAASAYIVPHAGYRYSGATAGAAYAMIPAGRWRRALVLAPSHYMTFRGGAVFPGRGFETPLGLVAIDEERAERLSALPLFEAAAAPYASEHSIEIQLPFLQVIDPALAIVPLLLGVSDDVQTLDHIAEALAEVVDDETLVVVSSDFTHYGEHFAYEPFPAEAAEDVAAALRRLDFGAIDPICRGDARGFERYVRDTAITICGRGPISTFLRFVEGGYSGRVERYATSLEVTGDYQHSVSYASISFRAESTA